MSTPISYRLNTMRAWQLKIGDMAIYQSDLYKRVSDRRLPHERKDGKIAMRRVGFFDSCNRLRLVSAPQDVELFTPDASVELFVITRAEAQR